MTEHTHDHDDDSACAVAHGAVAPPSPATSATGPAATSATGPAATSATGPAATSASSSARAAGERTLVAVFASPVAGYLLRYGADMGFRGLLLEPDEGRAAGAAALGFPLLAAVPDDLDDSVDLVVTDHHRPQLGVMLRDALATKARWVGIMGNPHHAGPHVEMLTELGVPAEEIARVHRPIGLNIGSRTPPEIAISTLAGLLADRNGRPGGFEF
jgi:xanthine dehydrogenase accessory factor